MLVRPASPDLLVSNNLGSESGQFLKLSGRNYEHLPEEWWIIPDGFPVPGVLMELS